MKCMSVFFAQITNKYRIPGSCKLLCTINDMLNLMKYSKSQLRSQFIDVY